MSCPVGFACSMPLQEELYAGFEDASSSKCCAHASSTCMRVLLLLPRPKQGVLQSVKCSNSLVDIVVARTAILGLQSACNWVCCYPLQTQSQQLRAACCTLQATATPRVRAGDALATMLPSWCLQMIHYLQRHHSLAACEACSTCAVAGASAAAVAWMRVQRECRQYTSGTAAPASVRALGAGASGC